MRGSVFTPPAAAMAATLAITVALEHSSFHNTDVICKLLCINKEMRSQVLRSCAGQLPLTSSIADADQADRLALWVSRHGSLLKSWRIWSRLQGNIGSLLVSHVAVALQEAAEESPLLLQSFSMSCSVTATLLQQLPMQHLTQLSFTYNSTPTSDQRIRASLSKLSSLQELTLHCWCSTDAVVPALSTLSNLTRLSLGPPVHNIALLQQLPQQLVDLELSPSRDLDNYSNSDLYSSRDLPEYAVQLGHLTAVTRLATIAHEDNQAIIVRQHDELPPNLQALFVTDCCVHQPLLQLSQLQQLSMTCSTTLKQDLQLLSHLTTLTDVSLKYYDDSYLDVQYSAAAAAAWTAVPGLRSLHLSILNNHTQLTDAVAKKIAELTSLTELIVESRYMYRHTAVCLQEAVAKLTALKTLTLAGLQTWQGNTHTMIPPSEAPPGEFALLTVCSTFAYSIAGLPSLSSLELWGFQMTNQAAKVLAGASQLTYLSLGRCDLSDHMVESFLPNMLELRSLDISENSRVTGSCVDMIAGLKQLTELDLRETGVLLHDMQRLTCLTGLKNCSPRLEPVY